MAKVSQNKKKVTNKKKKNVKANEVKFVKRTNPKVIDTSKKSNTSKKEVKEKEPIIKEKEIITRTEIRKEKKHNKIKKYIVTLISLICIGMIAYSSYKLIFRQVSLNKNNKIKEQTNEAVTVVEETKKDDKTEEVIVEQKLKVDFDKLKELNPDTVAYLKIKNTDIEYVVVQTDNNNYYLTHNFNKEYNTAGWIFADYTNKFDGTDKNIVVYGHSMKDESMFGTIYKLFNSEWLSNPDNYDLIFYTPGEDSIYRVFSIYSILVEDYYITTDFSNTDFNTFIRTIKNRSFRNFDTEVNENDTILTLSTCTTDTNKRLVVHAKKIIPNE